MERPRREGFVAAAIIVGGILWTVGVIDTAFTAAPRVGLVAAIFAVALQAGALWLGRDLDAFRTWRRRSGGRDYDRLRFSTRLRAAGLVLNGLVVLSAILLIVAAYGRVTGSDIGSQVAGRVLLIMALLLGVATAIGHYESFRAPHEMSRSWLRDLFVAIFLGACGLAIVVAAFVAIRPVAVLGREWLSSGDVQAILLAAQTSLAAAILVRRSIPTFYTLFRADPGAEAGDPATRARHVLIPTLAAFALLFILVLVVLAYGIGLADVLDEVSQNQTLLVLLAILGVVLAAVVWLAVRSGASAEQAPPLIRKILDAQERKENILVLVSGGAAIVFVALGIVVRAGLIGFIPEDAWFDIIGVGVLVALGPYGFYAAAKHRRIRAMEDRFPDFLRDLASSHKGGLTLYSAVAVAARGDYGALTPEVNKMADQLSWHVPFEEALRRFGERVRTPLVERSINLILEASRSGGSTTDVLMAAARDAREIKNLENDRRISMTVYTIVVYVTFLVFLLVAAILYARFVPQIIATSEAASSLGSGSVGGVTFANALELQDYRVFYFTAAIVQGIGDGIIAGLMGSGRAVLGLRHSFWMVLIAWLTFVVFI